MLYTSTTRPCSTSISYWRASGTPTSRRFFMLDPAATPNSSTPSGRVRSLIGAADDAGKPKSVRSSTHSARWKPTA